LQQRKRFSETNRAKNENSLIKGETGHVKRLTRTVNVAKTLENKGDTPAPKSAGNDFLQMVA